MMYVGDCQVVTGNGMMSSSESLFQTSIENHHNSYTFLPQPNLPFRAAFLDVPKEEMGLMGRGGGKEELESGSGSEHIDGGGSGNEQEYLALEQHQQQQHQQQNPNSKKKRYHRHTAHQIQEMEAMFKECPHPDDKQRMKLSTELGLKPRQVKFWFQNRRTQMKAQQDRADNAILRAENENLKSENYRLQAALRNIVCPTCGGPGMMGEVSFDEQQLRLENARLKDEFERVCCLAAQYCGRPIHTMGQVLSSLLPPTSSLDLDMNIYPRQQYEETISTQMMPVPMMTRENSHFLLPNNNNGAHGVMIMEEEKSLALELAISFMDELLKMCQTGDPLWILDGPREVLNIEEHSKMFSWPISKKRNPNQEWRHEATRASAVVIMNSITLVDAFIDAEKWIDLFPSIISRAKTLQIITSGVSGHANGSLQLMYAELQVLSPLVPTRETHFLRYCHHNAEEGTWAIVDFPLDSFHENYTTTSYPRYRRRPSGCIIQDMPNGYSRVTWVEHAEVADECIHRVFNEFVTSDVAFGAQRWLAVLQRQCERLASLMARNISDLGVIPSPEARKNLMNLSQRMIRMFCVNVSSACGHSWTALSDSADSTVRITTRKVTEPGQPNGLILSAVSTTWFPYPHYQVFDLLKDERRRAQLDVLSNGNALHEVAHIANGSHPGNCISLLRVNVASNSSQNVELMLQESCTDESGSLIVYSTIDVESIQLAMNGQDPSCIPLLPLGFVIVPMTKSTSCNAGDSTTTRLNSSPDNQYYSSASPENYINGCLLTVGLQALTSSIPTAKLNLSSASAINNHICNTMHQISAALSNGIDAGGNDNGSGDVVSGEPPASAAALPLPLPLPNKIDDNPTP